MDKKNKTIILLLSLMVLAIVIMVVFIYFDRRTASFPEVVIPEEYEEPEPEEYDGPEIPELTPGDTIEEIEQDLEFLDINGTEEEFEEIEREIEELTNSEEEDLLEE